jgi:transposase
MTYNFLPVDRDQQFLLPVDMKEWLSRDHFVYFLVEVVDELDITPFLVAYRADGRGGAAYHPAMMVTLLMYAYCDGERSSRRIEEHCRTDIAYRYITGGLLPDHATIARFRDRHEKDIADLFIPVLAVCLHAGMDDVAFAAIDGTKFRCPASLRANRTLTSIEKELAALTDDIEAELARIVADILAESRRADLADDPLPGTPPDQPRQPGTLPPIVGLPKSLHGKASRRARLARARQVLDDEHAAECAAHEARLRERAARIHATGKGIPGRIPQPPVRDPEKKIKVTDPDSRVMKGADGAYVAGYNAQNAVSGDFLNLAPRVVNDANDTGQLHPMMTHIGENLAAAGATEGVAVFAGDAGYRTQKAVDALDPDGPVVLMPAVREKESRRRAAEEPTREGPPPDGLTGAERIDWLLDTAWGKQTYRRRAATVETGFGQEKHNRGFRRFSRVGLPAADSEWKLVTLTSNIQRLFRRILSGQAAPAFSAVARLAVAPG